MSMNSNINMCIYNTHKILLYILLHRLTNIHTHRYNVCKYSYCGLKSKIHNSQCLCLIMLLYIQISCYL